MLKNERFLFVYLLAVFIKRLAKNLNLNNVLMKKS